MFFKEPAMQRDSVSSLAVLRPLVVSESVKQALLLLSIFQQLFYPVISLIRGKISLEDAHARFQHLKTDDTIVLDEAQSETSHSSSSSGTQDTESATPSNAAGIKSLASSFTSADRILYRAIVQNDLEAVSRMVEIEPSLAARRNEGGWCPLHAAILSGAKDIVKLLLEHPKVDVDAKHRSGSSRSRSSSADQVLELGQRIEDTGGATALHYACMIGNVNFIHQLVEHGASFKAKDDYDRKPVEYFNFQGQSEAVAAYKDMYAQWEDREEYFKVYNTFDELVRLIKKDRYELFERAIKKNPNLASKCADVTLLHVAVVLQRRRFVELLISTDKSLVNKCDTRSPCSCLSCSRSSFFSIRNERPETSFAPPTVPYKHVKNATPLHYACLVKDMDLAKFLLEAGADWDVKDWQGRTPEDLIHTSGEAGDEIKGTFSRLRDAEKQRRKEAGEGRKDAGEVQPKKDKDEAPPKVSMETLLSLENKIGEKLVGQRGPIHLVANAIRLREGGWVDPDRPLTMLFLGSSGVGKTELAKQVALYLHGKDGVATDKGQSIAELEKTCGFVRIDMSEFQERHTIFNLIGAPKSYVGYRDGGALTQPLKKNPKAVVLLDEIEKAHPDVLNLFLQVFDDGRITDSMDGTVCCKNAIFIMTSNIAGEEIKNAAPGLRRIVEQSEKEGRPETYVHHLREFTRTIRPQLKQHLKRDEFIGRINQIVVFLPLSQEEIEVAVQRELEMWCKRSEERHRIKLVWTDEVVRKLARSYDVNYGVRSVSNEVQRIALQLVAGAHMRGWISDNFQAELSLNEVGDIVMHGQARPEDVIDIFSDFIWSFGE